MIRRLGSLVVLAACTVAAAAGAATASAHQFTGSESASPSVIGEGAQEFSFKPFKITCEEAKSVKLETTPTWPSPTLYVAMKYSKCTTFAGKFHKVELPPIKTTFLTPVDFEYHANGFVESGAGSESSSEIKNAGALEISIKGDYKCVVTWEAQTTPAKAVKKPTEEYEAALYEKIEETTENLRKFPTGIQDKLLIKNHLTKMKYSLSEGICEEFETTEGKAGSYTGTLKAELKKGNFGWE